MIRQHHAARNECLTRTTTKHGKLQTKRRLKNTRLISKMVRYASCASASRKAIWVELFTAKRTGMLLCDDLYIYNNMVSTPPPEEKKKTRLTKFSKGSQIKSLKNYTTPDVKKLYYVIFSTY